jgi:hypothetical protein
MELSTAHSPSADRAALRQIGTDLLADVTNETATRDQAIARIPALLDAL